MEGFALGLEQIFYVVSRLNLVIILYIVLVVLETTRRESLFLSFYSTNTTCSNFYKEHIRNTSLDTIYAFFSLPEGSNLLLFSLNISTYRQLYRAKHYLLFKTHLPLKCKTYIK